MSVKVEQGHVVRVVSGPGKGRKGTVRFRCTVPGGEHTARILWDELGTADTDVSVDDIEVQVREGRHLVWRKGS